MAASERRRTLRTFLNQRLANRTRMMGEQYTIADIAIFPWVPNLLEFYQVGDLVGSLEAHRCHF